MERTIFRVNSPEDLINFCDAVGRGDVIITGEEEGFRIYVAPVNMFGKHLCFVMLPVSLEAEVDTVDELFKTNGYLLVEGGIQ